MRPLWLSCIKENVDCCSPKSQGTTMMIKAIVYNKIRKFAGHTFEIEISDDGTVADFKDAIEDVTTIPSEEQWIVFGVTELADDIRLCDLHIQEGYTLYVTPTTVELPEYPNL